MLLVSGISGDPDALVRDNDTVLNGNWGLSPLEVKDVVRDVIPVLTDVLSVVKFFVNAARLIDELGAGSP